MRWLPVVGYEGVYEVSDTGRVRSLPRKTLGRWGKLKTTPGGLLKGYELKWGYIRVDLSKDGKTSHQSVHRMVALAHIPNPDNKPCVNHIDNIRHNNKASNLEWCTHKENTAHSMAQGRFLAGKYNYGLKEQRAKLALWSKAVKEEL